jgi:phospholipase C
MALSDIDAILIVIMENRSFDHMLGYLSLDVVLNVGRSRIVNRAIGFGRG